MAHAAPRLATVGRRASAVSALLRGYGLFREAGQRHARHIRSGQVREEEPNAVILDGRTLQST